ncbi:Carboxylesterase NlhH [Nocardioides dokdonensis FR1436]|uniref:Carboxylesterase NlhH n=1 Tax=Nocardioides dokdonensis FR1436 TaxID=1300347 RepID=A0A1A9GM82_9ACTN|nr:alpha/beta hydrolase [Nocardioides dokdonensis]ANH38555.1 Carboxylesterase NlhH [Nocardioides dokdonensis FR1436]
MSDRSAHPRLPLGVRALDSLFRVAPSMSVARMDEERLRRVQGVAIPTRGPANLLLGRPRRGVRISTRTFDAGHGPLPLRLYTPTRATTGPRPVVLHLHGGGFVLGSARQGDWLCSVVADELDAVVVAVDYRLAPTHRFPAALEDCYEALLWTAAHARELGADPDRLGLMGDSAGGNLAAVLALVARDEGGPGVRHQGLVYPATDLTDATREHASYVGNRGIVLSNDDLEVFYGHYLPEGTDPADWRLSPVRAPDLSGLPPALVVVAGLDPLHDSGVGYAEALVAAGTPARVEDFHLMPHGFLSFPYLARSARDAATALVTDQRRHLGGARPGS